MAGICNSASRATALKVVDVSKTYGSHVALAGVSCSVEHGEIVGLVGRNGAGKTTLVSIIAGLRRADTGSVRVCGADVGAEPSRCSSHRGYAAQELAIYPGLTTAANLWFFASLSMVAPSKVAERIEQVADALDLTALLGTKAAVLSGGQQRRLHVAAALLHEPDLLVLDEPTAGVDIESRDRLLEVLLDLRERGVAVLYSTHYLPEVEKLDARVVVLDEGAVLAEGNVRDLVRRFASSYVELRFDGELPLLANWDVVAVGSDMVRVRLDALDLQLPRVLTDIGTGDSQVRSIEILPSNMDSAFVAITGRRIDETPA